MVYLDELFLRKVYSFSLFTYIHFFSWSFVFKSKLDFSFCPSFASFLPYCYCVYMACSCHLFSKFWVCKWSIIISVIINVFIVPTDEYEVAIWNKSGDLRLYNSYLIFINLRLILCFGAYFEVSNKFLLKQELSCHYKTNTTHYCYKM